MEEIIVDILKRCHLVKETLDELNGLHIPREVFLNEIKYEELKENINKLKKYLCTSSFTSLHKNAESKQNWPLLNLVRQLLKISNYKMTPYKKSNGYTKEGKKKYLRFFIIKEIKSKEVNIEVPSME